MFTRFYAGSLPFVRDLAIGGEVARHGQGCGGHDTNHDTKFPGMHSSPFKIRGVCKPLLASLQGALGSSTL